MYFHAKSQLIGRTVKITINESFLIQEPVILHRNRYRHPPARFDLYFHNGPSFGLYLNLGDQKIKLAITWYILKLGT